MARRERLANNAETTLVSAVVPADTTISVASAAAFPTEGDFRIVVDAELMLVTSVSGATFTVTRGIESTAAANHNSGAALAQVITAEGMQKLIAESVDPMAFARPPFRIVDSTGSLLTETNFLKPYTNVGGAYTDNADGSITISTPDTADQIPLIARTAPTAPYTITGAYRCTWIADGGVTDDGPLVGPCFRDSVGDEILTFRHRPGDAVGDRLGANTYTAESHTPTAVGNKFRCDPGIDSVIWFKITDNNTNLQMSISFDGVYFIQFLDRGRTTDLATAPDQVGLCIVNPITTDFDAHLTLLAWDGE